MRKPMPVTEIIGEKAISMAKEIDSAVNQKNPHRESTILSIIIRKIKKLIVNNTIHAFEHFIKKDYHLWLFSMEGGRKLSGNVLYLLEYVQKYAPEVKTVCFADKTYVKERIEALGSKACKPNSWESLCCASKAGVCIFSHEMASDLNNFSKKGTLKINLWHGLPLKRFQYGSKKIRERIKNKPIMQKLSDRLAGYVQHEESDFIVYTTENLQGIMLEAFNNPNLFLTGDPRDDIFFRTLDRNAILSKYGLQEAIGMKVVTYLPTFRDVRRTDENYVIFSDAPEMVQKVAQLKAVVLQKNHTPITSELVKKPGVYLLPEEVETQELLYVTDILITDYSSVYFDFLHTLRPIIFYPYDLKEYIREDRELYYDYHDELATPGLKAFNEREVLACIERYIANPQLDKEKRKRSLSYFHQYSDGKSCERVYQTIKQLLIQKKRIREEHPVESERLAEEVAR